MSASGSRVLPGKEVSCEPRGARLSLRPCGVAVGHIQFQTHAALSYVDDVHARCILYSQSDENIRLR